MSTVRVAAFTGGETISSRRFRVMQYVDVLREHGVEIDEFVSHFGAYPPPQRWRRPTWFAATLMDRILPTLKSRAYDVVLLQREFISTFYTLERFTHRPRVLDVDDAIWLINARSGRSFSALARDSDGVICGNQYIADTVSQWNRKTFLLPTAVDTERFSEKLHHDPPPDSTSFGRKIIGWSGLHAGAKFLLEVEAPIHAALKARPGTILRVVSDLRPAFREIPDHLVEFIRWSPENEVRTIQEMDIGLMPIDQTEWSRGKCSYKMLLSMSCGLPVVVTPFGMNSEVLALGDVGFGPRTRGEWTESLVTLLDDSRLRHQMGRNGRAVIEQHFSRSALAPKLAACLRSF